MKTSERAPLREPAVSNDPLPPRSVRAGAGSRRRAVILAAALMVVASASTGVGVYAWQHAQVRDRDAALLTALQERDEADREAAALRGDAVLTSGEVAALQARVQHLRARVDGLRSTVADLSQQFGSAPSCNAADMLAAIRDDVDIAPSMVWESVSIQECQNGYARVYAHPGHVPVGRTSRTASRCS